MADNRWSHLARQVTGELERDGVACVAVPRTGRAEVLELLGRSRVFVHPMRVEGNSRLGCEARAMGAVPVVLDSNLYAVGLDEAGGAVPVSSVEEMAGTVTGLLADAPRLERLSATGMATARSQIAWEPYVERIDEALATEAEDPGRAARAGLGLALSDDIRGRERLESDLAAVQADLATVQADLERHRGWLESTNASLSWRMTGPLRSAKRFLPSRRER
jgi:hypothetical protein